MSIGPLEALDLVIHRSSVLLHNSDRFPPGGVVQRQDPSVREALQQLTSKMTQEQRVDPMDACGPFWDSAPMMREVHIENHQSRVRRHGWLAKR